MRARALLVVGICLLAAGAAHAVIDFTQDCDGYTINIYTANQLPPGASASGMIVVQLTEQGGEVITCSDPLTLTADANGVVDLTLTNAWCEELMGTYTSSGAITGYGQVYPFPTPREPLVCDCTGRIGDFVWNDGIVDMDCDGIQPADMTLGINGVNVCLLDAAGAQIACTVTAEVTIGGQLVGGYYSFDGLCAGDYTVVVETPAGFVPAPSMATDPADDSNGSPANVSLPMDDSVDVTIDFGYCTEMGGGQGCTPGYWKNHVEDWQDYGPDDVLGDVFSEVVGYGDFGGLTLLEALQSGPEPNDQVLQAVRNLMRIAVASLLSASSDAVDFGATPQMVVDQVNAALATGDADVIEDLKNYLDRQNNSGCPL